MYSKYLSVGLEAVKQAETPILKYLSQDIRAKIKEDRSPVTIADQEAEEVIKRCISSHFPDHSFHGEEGEKIDLNNHKGFTWIIDPIDGTKSYLRRNPLFATQMALLKDGEFVVGISNAPLMKELMYAQKGDGCFFNGNQVKVSQIANLDDAYLSFGSLDCFKKHGNLTALTKIASEAKWARGIGDFWSYHLLAQGKLEIMIEADTQLWDIAAVKVIVEEAGGKFTQLDGAEIGPSSTTALATNSLLHDAILTTFESCQLE